MFRKQAESAIQKHHNSMDTYKSMMDEINIELLYNMYGIIKQSISW
jgi:hypothetical protein